MKYPPVHYHDYLKLDSLLGSQKRRSEEFNNPAHDEMLFITVHQAYELWFKQILFEMNAVIDDFNQVPLPEATLGMINHRLHRVISILKLILGQIDVLETMTPMDFLEFRDYLYPASGFQSFQFRAIETLLGLRREDRHQFLQTPFESHLKPDQQKVIQKILSQPSLLDLVESWLERTPFVQTQDFDFWKKYSQSVEQMISEDKNVIRMNPRLTDVDKEKSLKMMEGLENTFKALLDESKFAELKESKHFRISHQALRAALMIQLYRDESIFQQPFQLITHMLDIDETLTQWRYRHALMAHRMLGSRIGTGGSSGNQYLKDAADKHKIFTDFFNLTSFLIPRSKRPDLPANLKRQMNFLS